MRKLGYPAFLLFLVFMFFYFLRFLCHYGFFIFFGFFCLRNNCLGLIVPGADLIALFVIHIAISIYHVGLAI